MLNQNIKNYFKQKNCLVTGGTGMIGREISKILVNFGANVKAISLDKIKIHDKVDQVYWFAPQGSHIDRSYLMFRLQECRIFASLQIPLLSEFEFHQYLHESDSISYPSFLFKLLLNVQIS